MKSFVNQSRILLVLLAGLLAMQVERSTAQTFTNFYNFQTASTNQYGVWTNRFGLSPNGTLLLLDGRLYGAALHGGTNGTGCIYAVGTNGVGFTNLYVFSALATNKSGISTNRDGADPAGGLVLSGSTLFGAAWYGGTNGHGTIFSLATNGSGFTTLRDFAAGATNLSSALFTNSDGTTPLSGLALSGDLLFGTTGYGGTNGNGTVFAMQTNGLSFTNLHVFSTLVLSNNNDGANPYATLSLAGGTLYGTTQFGGTNANGTIFSVATNGINFTNLHNFARLAVWSGSPNPNVTTNGDGATSRGQLTVSGTTLFGTATFGGLYGNGTVFALFTNGMSFTNLHNFAAGALDLNTFGITNSDGAWPQPGVLLLNNTLYGVCEYDGLGLGTVFSLGTNGSSFTVLHYFPQGSTLTILPNSEDETNTDGAYPQTSLIVSGGSLCASAAFGGWGGSGTLYDITLAAPSTPGLNLVMVLQHTNAVLTWPTNLAGYGLQFTTNLNPAAWFAATPSPVITGTNYSVTNGIIRTNRFYRLLQP